VIIGVFAGSRRGTRTDGTVVIGSLVFWSLPTFWVGMLLIFVFAVTLGWLPIAGMFTADALYPTVFTQLSDLARHLVLPTIAMVLVDIAQFVLITRSSLLATLSEDYMTTAGCCGATGSATRCFPWSPQPRCTPAPWSAAPSRWRRCSPGRAWAS
jgi:peptide/nickel transport system permease protein